MTQSAFVISQVIVQIENNLQPPQWSAPVLFGGVNIVVDSQGSALYPPAYQSKPVGIQDFPPDVMEAINNQLKKVGLHLSKIETPEV